MATLGQYLAELRQAKALTFRDLEQKTGISNGYLNLLEHGRVKRPSPEVLFKLANFYGIPFASLMNLAGYPSEEPERTTVVNRSSEVAVALLKDLTKDELAQVRSFIGYLKAERRQRK
jgi:HTH-type transcriptional regulator, competence development regulator